MTLELPDFGKDADISLELVAALQIAVQALNTAPCFKIRFLNTDSYEIAPLCERVIKKAESQ